MNTLDLTLCTPTNIFFPTSGTINFLQLAYTQGIASAIIEELGAGYSTSAGYIMYGCVATVGVSSTTITAGAIFYNGEVFLSPAQTITNPTGGDVLIVNIVVTQYTVNADPATFTDGTHNIHNIRSAGFAAGTAGAGTMGGIDFSALILMRFVKDTNIQRFAAPVFRTLIGAAYDSSKFYVIYGCVATGANVSAGAIFHDGNIYITDGYSAGVFCGGGTQLVFYYGDDYTLNMACGSSGSGAVDFTGLISFTPPWISLSTFGSGWAAPGGGVDLPFYRRTTILNEVSLKGIVVSSSTTPSQGFCNLPVGYRPLNPIYRVAACYRVGTNTFDVVTLIISTAGSISFFTAGDVPTVANDFISIDGIKFNTD